MNVNKAYQNFFLKTEEGRYFMDYLAHLIDDQHQKAEKNPELARDYTQRAKGVREVLDHINVSTIERK